MTRNRKRGAPTGDAPPRPPAPADDELGHAVIRQTTFVTRYTVDYNDEDPAGFDPGLRVDVEKRYRGRPNQRDWYLTRVGQVFNLVTAVWDDQEDFIRAQDLSSYCTGRGAAVARAREVVLAYIADGETRNPGGE